MFTAITSTSILSLCAEPASIVYIVTGVVGMAFAGRKSAKARSVNMSFCSQESRELVKSVDLV